MSDLAEFLLARVAEDESVARAVQDVPPKSARDVFTSLSAPTGTVEMSPRRVLAECDAKRRIANELRDEWEFSRDARVTLRILALPYADHPDYREEWKP